MHLKDILKLVGAGITAGYLVLKMNRPRRDYDEFLQVYGAISLEFRHQLQIVFLQTMLPAVSEEDRERLFQLLDCQATFLEQMRFFQSHVVDFDELIIKALERLYRLKAEGSIAPTTRRRTGSDPESFSLGVAEAFHDLETSFLEAVRMNAAEDRRLLVRFEDRDLPHFLRDESSYLPSLGRTFFDAMTRFEEILAEIRRR